MEERELEILAAEAEKIEGIARNFDLHFFPMRFELVPADIIYTFGAYGMPVRFSHWSFGKQFQRLKTQYDYNLSRIYELVINSDPCYAFLLEGNSLVQNKLVIAHVYAHSDFFRNNQHFRSTNPRTVMDIMALHAARLREYEMKYGRREVEIFLDAVLAVQEHIDPFSAPGPPEPVDNPAPAPDGPYADLWALDGNKQPPAGPPKPARKFLPRPQKDLLLFIMENAYHLEDWQRDVIAMVREEMLYFWPQMETKMINEGWATYWHTRIIRELDLPPHEAVEAAKLQGQLLAAAPVQINPYLVGLKIYEDMEKRWDTGDAAAGGPPGRGREKIFEVRETENDISFIRNHLTEELVEELDLYLYQKMGPAWVVVEKDWEKVRDGMVASLSNGGFPYLEVVDGDYGHRGELYLRHLHEGRDMDLFYLEKTLPYVYLLWGRPVHLETKVGQKPTRFSYDGQKNFRQVLSQEG